MTKNALFSFAIYAIMLLSANILSNRPASGPSLEPEKVPEKPAGDKEPESVVDSLRLSIVGQIKIGSLVGGLFKGDEEAKQRQKELSLRLDNIKAQENLLLQERQELNDHYAARASIKDIFQQAIPTLHSGSKCEVQEPKGWVSAYIWLAKTEQCICIGNGIDQPVNNCIFLCDIQGIKKDELDDSVIGYTITRHSGQTTRLRMADASPDFMARFDDFGHFFEYQNYCVELYKASVVDDTPVEPEE